MELQSIKVKGVSELGETCINASNNIWFRCKFPTINGHLINITNQGLDILGQLEVTEYQIE